MKNAEQKIRVYYWDDIDIAQFILALIVIGACMLSVLVTVLTTVK